jgi:predicted amino acid dehydrogenase
VVGLGAYTSIVTDNGELLGDVGALVTTGNAFTVASAVDALTRLGGRRHDVAHATCGVVGAAGNIGQACALLLAERCGRLVLGGNPATPQRSRSRLRQVAEDVVAHLVERGTDGHSGDLARRVGELARSGSGIPELTDRLLGAGLVRVATGIGAILGTAPLVVVATSTPESVVAPHLPLPGAVLCDVSQPPNIGPEVALRRPDVDVVPGGLVEMPAGRDLGVDFGLAPGVTYACTAETLVAAARLDDPVLSRGGRLDLDAVRVVGDQARELGFRLHVTQGGSL